MTGDIVVIGVGARIATGLDALTAAMSIRARKSFVRETRFVDRAGEPIALAAVTSIGEDIVGRDRFVALGAPPMAEALRSSRARWDERGQTLPSVPVILALPAEADPLDPRGAKLLAALGDRAGVAVDATRSKILAQGRAAGAAAIELAAARLRSGEDEVVLVGGIDSYFDPDRLEALDAQRRLHGPATENGFIPGEGAAFLLLASRRRAGGGFFASVAGVTTQREPRPFGSREPCHALGITLALKRAIERLGPAKIGWALTDVVGERHRVDEWLFASGRIQASLAADLRHDTPLMLTGDIGAASTPMLVALACVGWQVGCAPADLALVAAHSDGPERGALLLASPSAGDGAARERGGDLA